MARSARIRFCLVTLISFVLIGIGLRHLRLEPGMPLPSLERGDVVIPTPDTQSVGVSLSSLVRTAVLLIVAALTLFAIIQAARRVPWKRIVSRTWALVWKVLFAAAVLALVVAVLPKSSASAPAQPLLPPRAIRTSPLGSVPTELIWIVAAAFVGISVIVGIRILAARRSATVTPFELELERATQALLDGHDLRTVILRCYQRMSQALLREHNIERESFMTTGEFEKLLTARGIPRDPVHQLTGLFEAVRYGRQEPGSSDQQAAIRCLSRILRYSRGMPPEA